uniref:PRKR-interacting protein 1 homolog n=1 Tax=Sinocyclocheilus rhinocerous TaxID=307959 RepID=A0A673IXQ2_9TELE
MAVDKKDTRSGKAPKKESQPLIIAKTPAEKQRLKLERLMARELALSWSLPLLSDREPRSPRRRGSSSAGAGSGEFHVYRHLRRREYQRQDFLERISEKQKLDEKYIEKVNENQKAAEERTAKRRKKREKLKQKMLAKKAKMESQKEAGSEEKSSSSASEAEEREDDAEVPSFIMGKR